MEKLNIVIICTPTNTHFQLIQDCLNNGKHVMCEKPLANSIANISNCYDLAHTKNLVLLCALNRRFDPEIIRLKEQINSIGNIYQVTTISHDYPYPSYD